MAEATALWLMLNPPAQRPGLCAHCDKPLEVPMNVLTGAPVRVDGAWLHWGCLPRFLNVRWAAAKEGLKALGLPPAEKFERGDCGIATSADFAWPVTTRLS
jgi:hypothetical protein